MPRNKNGWVYNATEQAPGCSLATLEDLRQTDAQGGFAKILKGESTNGKPIAIKCFFGEKNSDPEKFEDDASVAKREYDRLLELNGANGHAPKPFGFGTVTDEYGMVHIAIAMEWVEGVTLEQALHSGMLSGDRFTGNSIETTVQIMGYISEAVGACHPVVHRDLSPRNIMLVMGKAGKVVKIVLVDFGQAAVSTKSKCTPVSGPHKLATVHFGAPEMWSGPYYQSRNKTSVDVYSLGAITFYLATRAMPYNDLAMIDSTTTEGMARLLAVKAKPIDLCDHLKSNISNPELNLAGLIFECTRFNPEERPSIKTFSERVSSLALELNDQSSALSSATDGNSKVLAKTECDPIRLMQTVNAYLYGINMPRSAEKAEELIKLAADGGSSFAQFHYGKALVIGSRLVNGRIDRETGMSYLADAAKSGHEGASICLGML